MKIADFEKLDHSHSLGKQVSKQASLSIVLHAHYNINQYLGDQLMNTTQHYQEDTTAKNSWQTGMHNMVTMHTRTRN